jgi:hypothetical protein
MEQRPLYKGKISKKTHIVNHVLTDTINNDVKIQLPVDVKIQSLIDAHLLYDGKVSQRHYEWTGAGAIVSVDERDVPELLAKRLGGNTCCGGNRDGNQIFQLAQVEV